MKKINLISTFITLVLLLGTTFAIGAEKILKMSTTTSTQASGLLDVLLPEFEKNTGIKVKVTAKGTGAAIRDGMDGNVDIIFVHAKAREQKFIEEGHGTKRYAVMHNDFVVAGPSVDPAGVRGMKDAIAALTKIAASGSPFISRGDDSGTHTKEQALWQSAGLLSKKTDISFLHPDGIGKWYFSIGQGMGKTLTFADEKQGYTLADRGTYIKYKFGRDLPIDLEVLCEGDALLANPYGIIPVNPKKYPHVNHDHAKAFAEWLVSEQGQRLISSYKLLERQLFFPDAIPMK